jgi:hypothetical protein
MSPVQSVYYVTVLTDIRVLDAPRRTDSDENIAY